MTEPTDDELTAIYKAANGEDTGKAQPLTTQRIFRAMRAAIAKWGTPSGSGKVVAHRLVRKSPSGEWASDARDWSDGPPSRALVDSICADNGRWRIDVAYASPQQEPSHTAVKLAELVLSDCGHSSNYTPLLDRVAARIDSHVERRLDELRCCLESKPAPQPTQAQAVNQADRPFIVRLAEDFAEDCVTAGYVTTKAASYGRLMNEALSTQAQPVAVPLTDEQAASLCKMGPVYAPDGQVVRTPEQYRRELEGAKLAGIRTAERAHDIKGGQHGESV